MDNTYGFFPKKVQLQGVGPKLRVVVCFALPLLAFMAVFFEVFSFQSTFSHDALYWYPNFNYFINCLAQGMLPFWDPFSYGGAPFYLNHTLLGTMDPLTLIFVPFIKYSGLDIFSAFHASYLARFIVFYTGLYLLIYEHVRSHLATMAGSFWGLFALGTCAFRQNGYFIMMTYVPLFFWAVCAFLNSKNKSHGKPTLFFIAAISAGLTFNLYIPLYFLFSATVFVILLFFQKGWIACLNEIKKLHRFTLLWGAFLFFLLASPTLVILYECLFELNKEVISLTRSEHLLESAASLFSEGQVFSPEWYGRGSFLDLVTAFLPGYFLPYFSSPGDHGFSEHFFSIPLLLTFSILNRKIVSRCVRSYFRTFFLILIFCFLVFFQFPCFESFMKKLPLLNQIRQMGNFFGYFIMFFSILIAQIVLLFSRKDFRSLKLGLFDLKVFAFFYLFFLTVFCVFISFFPPAFFFDLKYLIVSMVIAFLSFLFLLQNYFSTFRKFSFYSIIFLLLLQSVVFSLNAKQHVLTPVGLLGKTPFDKSRGFTFLNYRFPFMPRPYHFTGFSSSLFCKPSLFYFFPNNYIFVPRRTLEILRYVSIDRLESIKAFGGNTLALASDPIFFDDPIKSLIFIATSKSSVLQNCLVLDNHLPSSRPGSQFSKHVLPRSFFQPWDFYKNKEFFSVKDFELLASQGKFLKPYEDLGEDLFFLDFSADEFGNSKNSFLMAPTFSSHAAFIENSVLLMQNNFTPILRNGFLPRNLGYFEDFFSPAVFQNTYNDKLRNVSLNQFQIVNCSIKPTTQLKSDFKILHFSANKLSFFYESKKPFWIYFADSNFPGWRAFCNGKPLPVVNANFCFKAAFVDQTGPVQVSFDFQPLKYKVAFLVFIFTAPFCFFYIAVAVGCVLMSNLKGKFLYRRAPPINSNESSE